MSSSSKEAIQEVRSAGQFGEQSDTLLFLQLFNTEQAARPSPPTVSFMENTRKAAQAIIPGAYDRSTLTRRQSGAMGGAASGTAGLPAAPSSMAPATILEREKEGGGGASQRPKKARQL